MKRSIYIRLLVIVFTASVSLLLLSYVHSRSSASDDGSSEGGKCSSGKSRSEYILWESLTHNLLDR
jgi:flagellar basal body-associated protein FliL